MRVDLKKVDVRLTVIDAPVGDLPVHVKCREHDDRSASLAVYPDHLHCFGCRFHLARRIDSLAYLLRLYVGPVFHEVFPTIAYLDIDKAISIAHKYTTGAVDAYRERVGLEARKDPLPNTLADVYLKLLRTTRESRMGWLRGRGLTDDTIWEFMLGHDGTRFSIPFFTSNGLSTIRFRRDDFYGVETWDGKEIPKYSGIMGRNASGAYLYPEWLVQSQKEDHVVVVESELCVIRLRQEGIPAVCTFSGAGAMKYIPKLLEPYEGIKKIWVAGDMDEAGLLGSKECIEASETAGYTTEYITWNPEAGKDPTELYQYGWKLGDVGYEA